MKDDIELIKEIARQYHFSIHRAAKSFYKYTGGRTDRNCFICALKQEVKYRGRKEMQCEIIGISGHKHANLIDDMVCDKFTRRKKNLWQMKLKQDFTSRM